LDGGPDEANSVAEGHFHIRAERKGPRRAAIEGLLKMRAPGILIVRRPAGYLRAILRNGRETVWGRDLKELRGRLALMGIRDPLAIEERKTWTAQSSRAAGRW
jgi:hypothetical protein